jgi:AAA+ ATPase superfamily predicted ATPase
MDKIIGRKAEVKQVLECFESDKSELVSVYGRRRVGKTFLIKRCFNEEFDFWFTGIYKATRVQHLTQFQNVLKEKSGTKIKKLQDWFQAFEALKNYLLSLNKDKVVVFLDEIPWMDTQRATSWQHFLTSGICGRPVKLFLNFMFVVLQLHG